MPGKILTLKSEPHKWKLSLILTLKPARMNWKSVYQLCCAHRKAFILPPPDSCGKTHCRSGSARWNLASSELREARWYPTGSETRSSDVHLAGLPRRTMRNGK